MGRTALEERIKSWPARPGVYLFKDAQGNILYVGKAASLRHRIRSYFAPEVSLAPKLRRLMGRVTDLEFMVTDTEQEALILECTLIKKHHPHYNVRLKDDKSYPYIKVTLAEDLPRVLVTRRWEKDGSRYFGPFASGFSVRHTLELVKKLFGYCSLSRPIDRRARRPCFDYHIKRCPGPCVGAVTPEEYHRHISQIILFLEGKQAQVVRHLRHAMAQAAARLEFEKAASLRDQLQAVELVIQGQKVVSPRGTNQDVLALAQDKDQGCVLVFSVRGGKLIGQEHYEVEGAQDEAAGQVLASFIQQFYTSAPYVPPTLLLQHPVAEPQMLEEWFLKERGYRVRLAVPHRGEKKRLVELAAQNAAQTLEQLRVKWLVDAGKTQAALTELEKVLALPALPRRMECFDISDIRGTAAVGSMVVFQDGRPKPSDYRRFRIKTVTAIDDYAMMREVLSRRFRRRETSGEDGAGTWAVVPDLLVIDGGKGHLSAALEVIAEVGAPSLRIASLAKEHEEIFLPDRENPVVLPPTSQALYLLQRLRDEAHRFALAYHQRVRQKTAITSRLDDIGGIGPKRKRALLKRYGSLRGIKEAPPEELAALPGFTLKLAQKVKEGL